MSKKKFFGASDMKIGLIGDEDTVAGMVLAGIGHVDGQGKKNFLVVDSKTHQKDVDEKFHELVSRRDISMVLITQGCAEQIRYAIDEYSASGQVVPAVLEIPSKDSPYDPRTRRMRSCSAWRSSGRAPWRRWASTRERAAAAAEVCSPPTGTSNVLPEARWPCSCREAGTGGRNGHGENGEADWGRGR
ncbi:unnamed protein product [Prorocentrum cordatum]|uniref:V-type proton ATPase subunit F n=1 Tax=Prorocentrum cordatum TaxID=2364126 RepID=A0ABN9QI36_9DINO|nr:unnamed protein product [Polarella glacialis]